MANIRCLLCNLVPMQIKNLDDYLCEHDHVVCKKCIILNAQRQLICPLCKSRIVKNRKILLETSDENIVNNINNNNNTNTNISRNNHEDIDNIKNQVSNQNFFGDDNSCFQDELRFWSNQGGTVQSPIGSLNSYTYDNSENNNNFNNGNMRYHMGDVPSDLYGFDQSCKRCPGDENMTGFERNIFLKNEIFDPNLDIIEDQDKLKLNNQNSSGSETNNYFNDTMLLYHKTINGKSDPNFDPQKHYYQTMHIINEKNEINRRPSINKLSDNDNNNNNNNTELKETESSLVLKRFAECQQQQQQQTESTQKKNLQPIIKFTYNNVIDNVEPNDDCNSETVVQTIYERPKLKLNTNNNIFNETKQSINYQSNNINNFNNNNNNNNNTNTNDNNQSDNRLNQFEKLKIQQNNKIVPQQSTRTILRNQIKEMTYSNIKENDVKSVKNGNFIAQCSAFKPSPLISLHIDRTKENEKSTFYTGVIQHHLNKAMEDLILNEQNCRNAKREKRQQIVKQEKEIIRKRIKDEIYKKVLNPITTIKNVACCEKSESILNNKNNMEQLRLLNDNINNDDQFEYNSNTNIQRSYSNKEFQNKSLSTESYPKLNPQLHVLAQTLTNFDRQYSKLHETSFDEIKKQFEKQAILELELINSIDNEPMPILCESISKNVIGEESNNSFNSQSNCHINNINSKTQSNIIDYKKSDMSEFCQNLNTETSAQELQMIHDVPEMRNLKFKNSITSTKTLTNDMIHKNSTKNLTDLNNIKRSMSNHQPNFIQNNLLFFEQLKNIEQQNFNQNQMIEKNIVEDEKSQLEIDVNNEGLKNFIEILKKKNPTMSNNDIYDIIRFLPTASTDIQQPPSIDNLQLNEGNNDNLTINTSSETTIENIEICNNDDISDDDDDYKCDAESNIIKTNNNAWRAYYCPPLDYCSEPKPQIRSIKLDKKIIFTIEPKIAGKLNIERHPVNCPITACKRKVFISEFTKHMKVDHTKTYIECISPGECRNLFLDPKVVHHGVNKCHNLYLITNKIRDLGSREYKNYLPIMLMSTKISLLELICSTYRPKDDEVKNSKQNYIVVWLTGLVASELPIYYTLIVWSRNDTIPKCHMVHSGKLYSFRDEQNAKVLFKKGQAMLLSKQNCDNLTDNGKNMVELQVIIH